jgi:hypothetical protein
MTMYTAASAIHSIPPQAVIETRATGPAIHVKPAATSCQRET